MAVRADWSARALGVDGCAAENFAKSLEPRVENYISVGAIMWAAIPSSVATREKAMRGRNLFLRQTCHAERATPVT